MLTPVPEGHLACIVTSLERSCPTPQDAPATTCASPRGLTLEWTRNWSLEDYRAMFRRVGGPWLWFSRLLLDDAALGAIIRDPAVHLALVRAPAGDDVGFIELDARQAGSVELAFLGLDVSVTGGGNGRWLMAHALARGALLGQPRLWVHSCTLDHPGALGVYRQAGFRDFARAVELFADPRLLGVLPRDVAPQVPLILPDAGQPLRAS